MNIPRKELIEEHEKLTHALKTRKGLKGEYKEQKAELDELRSKAKSKALKRLKK